MTRSIIHGIAIGVMLSLCYFVATYQHPLPESYEERIEMLGEAVREATPTRTSSTYNHAAVLLENMDGELIPSPIKKPKRDDYINIFNEFVGRLK